MRRSVALVGIDISEERIASIIKVKRVSEPGTMSAVTAICYMTVTTNHLQMLIQRGK
jgi:hypothetical protein